MNLRESDMDKWRVDVQPVGNWNAEFELENWSMGYRLAHLGHGEG